MKQLLTIAVVALLFVSCSKKDSVSKNELYGTRWSLRHDADNFLTLNFADNTNVVLSGKSDGEASYYKGTYMYSKPNVSVKITEDGETINMNGTVTGNVMSLTFYGGGEEFDGIFTKE